MASLSKSAEKIEYRIILIGNTGVGKTTLFKKLATGEFSPKNLSTIGVDKKSYLFTLQINKNGEQVTREFEVSLIDTAGQERYNTITKGYYKGAHGILLMYDITDLPSFKNVEKWVKNIEDNINSGPDKYIIFLIGNKLDQIGEEDYTRAVEVSSAKNICEQQHLIWGGEVSMKSMKADELNKLLQDYVIQIYDKIGDKIVKTQGSNILENYKKSKNKKNRDRCCLDTF